VALVQVERVEQLNQVLCKHHSMPDVVRAAAPLPILLLAPDEACARFVAGAVAKRALAAGGRHRVHDAGRRNCVHQAALAVAHRLG